MDARTADLIDALRHPGAALLLVLLEESATEAHLLAHVQRATQATTNRRLRNLELVGLIERDHGKSKAPGRAWKLCHESEVATLLRSAIALSTTVAETEAQERRTAERRINRVQARRHGLRDISAGR